MDTRGIDLKTFGWLAKQYRKEFNISLCAINNSGAITIGTISCPNQRCQACCDARAFALNEATRWGEPTVGFCQKSRLLWAVPLMHNEKLIGGIVANVPEHIIFSCNPDQPPLNTREACTRLRKLCEERNLTNASALTLKRYEYYNEQQRAYAIHQFKSSDHNSIRELYLKEEPALFSAIRAGDRGEAREILNRILVAIMHYAGNRQELVKSFFLELVVSMSRTAVEAGGDPQELLGTNFAFMAELSQINSETGLAAWLRRTLEHLLQSIERNRQQDTNVRLFDAIAYMERHCCEKLTRDTVAHAVYISPSHFSYLLRTESGTTFTDLLNRMRIDRAAELLQNSGQSLADIALETGFQDQSYFTKVFRKYRNQTPLQYRNSHKSNAPDLPTN